MIECVRRTQRNVKHRSSGEMGLRWTAAGMLEAEKQFRKVIGYQDLAKLAVAIEHDLDRRRQSAPPIRGATEPSTTAVGSPFRAGPIRTRHHAASMTEDNRQPLRALGDQLRSLLTEQQRASYSELVEVGEAQLALEMLVDWLSEATAPLPGTTDDEIHRLARALGHETRIDNALRLCPRKD